MRGQRMRHKIADREGRACEVCLATFRTLFQGAYSFTEKECVVRKCVMKWETEKGGHVKFVFVPG